MKGTIKRIALTAAFALFSVFVCHAEGSDYESLLAKARKYEEQGRYMYALGTYWDAMKADPKKAKDAYRAYVELASTLAGGNPGYGEYDEFSIYDGWVEQCKDFEKYWTENCPDAFTFSIRKGELDMATRTATYYVHILVERSTKFNDTAGYVIHGLQSKWKNSWTGIPKNWPFTSIYKDEEKNMMKNGVALIKETGSAASLASLHSMPSGSLYPTSSKNISSLFDVKFNVTDENGKVLLTSGRKRMGSSGGYEFKGVPQDVMKVIDSGKARIVPTGVWLEYGEVLSSYFDRSTYSIKHISFDDNRDWLKELPEIAMDVKQIEFYLPGGVNSEDKRVIGNAEFYVNDTGVVNVGKFYMMATEVTWGQYAAISGNGIPKSQSSRRPMNNIQWRNAVKYCNLVSELQGLTPCYSLNGSTDIYDWGTSFNANDVECNFKANGWRLPKVSEWQYAAQGGEKKDKYRFSGSNSINEVAWYYDNSEVNYTHTTHDVATKRPNSLGLYDMTGNVAEWCWDSFENTYSRAICGGNYYTEARYCDIPCLKRDDPNFGNDTVGFRMVRNAEELPDPEPEAVTTSSAFESKAEAESTKASAEEKKEAESTESKAKTKEKAKEEEKKAKKEEKKKAKEEKKEQEAKEKAAAEAEVESEADTSEGSEDDEEEDDDEDEKKSNIFTKAKDKAKEAKDKVVETKDKVKDKMTSKKKKKK